MSDAEICRVTAEDAPLIAQHRLLLFEEEGGYERTQLDMMYAALQSWLPERIAQEEYLGWFMIVDSQVAAGIGLWLRARSPTPRNLSLTIGHFCDVYTYPAFRRRGFARRLLKTAFRWCADHDLHSFSLAATEQGRPLYESFGFTSDHGAMILGSLPNSEDSSR